MRRSEEHRLVMSKCVTTKAAKLRRHIGVAIAAVAAAATTAQGEHLSSGSLSRGLWRNCYGDERDVLALRHHVVLHAEFSQPHNDLCLYETEAHGDHCHANEYVRGGEIQREVAGGRQLAETDGAQRGEAEVERLQHAPVLQFMEEHCA